MVQKHLLNLYPARTVGMLSGASRVAMMLLTTFLLTMTAQTAWAQTTVRFNRCGGEGGTDYVTATKDQPMPQISVPTRDGCIFGGYYSEREGGGQQYYNADGTSAHDWDRNDETFELHAKWTAYYTVTFDKCGGDGGTTSVDATYDAAMPSATMPTRDGYTFGGYFTEPSGHGTQYYNADGSSAHTWDIAQNTTLHAYWKKLLTNGEISVVIPAKTYSGTVLEPVVTVKDGEGDVSDEHYTVTLPEGRTNAGNYTITITANEESALYVGSVTKTFTINKAPLTVTANDHCIFYGNAAANDGVSYSGFVNGEDENLENVLSGELTYTYTNDNGSYGENNDAPGEYAITPGGDLTAANYNITFVSGTLTVEAVIVNIRVVDTADTDGEALSGATVQVLDAEEVVKVWTSGPIEDLRAGKTYTLHETIVPDGYLPSTDYTFTIAADGTITSNGSTIFDESGNTVLLVQNSMTHVEVSVVDIVSGDKLSGGYVVVRDPENQNHIVHEWQPTTANHVIEGLRAGKTYTLQEPTAPVGYILPTNTTFTIATDGTVTYSGTKTTEGVLLVQNSKTHVEVKVVDTADTDGEALSGAHVQVLDANENVVEVWTSTTDNHVIEGLEIDKTYTIHETVAPDGYILPTDYTFTIAANGTITSNEQTITVLLVENSKTHVKVSVVEMGSGQKLEDATVQVLDSEENVVAEWTSTTESHEIEGLKTGVEYILRETVAPERYIISGDFTFTIAEDGTITTTGTKTEDGVLLVQNSMTQVKISVVDIADGEELEGAHVQVIDSENNVVVEWDSTTEPHEIDGLNTGEEYTVHETVAPDGYTIPTDFTFTIGTDGRITTSGSTTTDEDGLTVLLVENERTGDLKVTCVLVSDLTADADAEFTFTVTLNDTSINGTYGGMTFENGVATFTLKGGESKTATGLPTTLTYTITEADAEGFQLTGKTGDTGTISTTTSEATFTNTRETGDLQLSNRVYADNNDDEFTFTVTLGDTSINGTYSDMTFENGVATVTLNGGEGATATGLPTTLTYTVSQTDKEGYMLDEKTGDTGTISTTTSEATFTNVQLVNATVQIVWNDNNNQDGKRPGSFTVTLSNGTEVTLNEENSWTATVEHLPKYANGEEIEYTWSLDEEGLPEGYELTDTSVDGIVTKLTISYMPEETEATVLIVWNDNNNQDGKRPGSFTVTLSNGTEVTLNEENSWTATVEHLPKYANGEEIVYTWTEDEEGLPEGYELTDTSVNGTVTTLTNSHTPEETEVKVTKVWDDADNQDGYRPDDVVINLLADGKIIDTVTLSEGNEWNYSWTRLDKKANGEDIDYTVTENAVAEYTTNITKATDGTFTYTVTNTHVLVTSGYCGATGSEESVTWNYNTDTKTLSISGAGYMMTYNYVQGAGNSAPWKAFANEMKSVTIGNGVTTIGQNAFRTCTGLTSVTIGSSVTYICSSAFYGCTGLTTVTIPASVTTIDPGAFYGCTGLTTVTLNRYVPSNEKPITALEYGRGFNGCDNLKLILVPNEDAYNAYYSNADWQAHQAKLAPQTLSVAKNASGWGTYCHNYPVSYSLSNDATAYEVAGLSQDGKSVTIAQADDNLVAPRTPLLLSYSGEGNVTLTAVPTTATTLSSTDALVSTTGTGWAFYGTTTALETIPDANYSAGLTYVLYGDKFLKSDNNSGIAANRCWLKLEAGGGTSGARLLSIVIDDNPTAIDNVQWSMVNGQSDSWYTLDGRKLSGKPTKKGLYIYNGKKTVVK